MINKFCIACQTKVGKQYLLDLLTLGSVVFFLCTTLQDCWFFFFCPQSLQHSSLHVWGFSHECTLWTGGAWAQHPGGLRRSTLEWRRCDCKSQLFVRKSNIQLPSVVLKPRVWSLPMSFMGEILLNAGPGVVFFVFFKLCEDRAEGSGDVGLLVLNAYMWESRLAEMMFFHVLQNQFLRALHQNGVSATGHVP